MKNTNIIHQQNLNEFLKLNCDQMTFEDFKKWSKITGKPVKWLMENGNYKYTGFSVITPVHYDLSDSFYTYYL